VSKKLWLGSIVAERFVISIFYGTEGRADQCQKPHTTIGRGPQSVGERRNALAILMPSWNLKSWRKRGSG
jgi:hypothetical protein